MNEIVAFLGAILLMLLWGAFIGWLAGKIMKSPHSFMRNALIGIVGGVIGSVVCGVIGITGSGMIGGIIVDTVGACLLIWISNRLK